MTNENVTILQLVLQIDLLGSHAFGLNQASARLQSQIWQLRMDNQDLKDQIARSKRNSYNSFQAAFQ